MNAFRTAFANFSHLALHRGVGISSGNVIEVSGRGEAICGNRCFTTNYPDEMKEMRPRAARPPRLPMISDEDFDHLADNVYSVPSSYTDWIWSPGSANFYRRSLIDVVRPEINLEEKHYLSPDGHFSRLAHWISGTAIISQTLSAYRVHGENYFSRQPSINGVISGSGPALKNFTHRRREMLRVLLERQGELVKLIGSKLYWGLLTKVSNIQPTGWKKELKKDFIIERLANVTPDMLRLHGNGVAIKELRKLIPFRTLRRILKQAHGGRIPSAVSRALTMRLISWGRTRRYLKLPKSFRRSKVRA